MTDLLELAAREQPNLDQLRQCAEEAADINVCMPATGNTALHLAAAAGSLEACKLLIELGADPLRRNQKNRTPGKQLKLEPDVKDYLAEVELAADQARLGKQKGIWDGKMRAVQTESALRVGTL